MPVAKTAFAPLFEALYSLGLHAENKRNSSADWDIKVKSKTTGDANEIVPWETSFTAMKATYSSSFEGYLFGMDISAEKDLRVCFNHCAKVLDALAYTAKDVFLVLRTVVFRYTRDAAYLRHRLVTDYSAVFTDAGSDSRSFSIRSNERPDFIIKFLLSRDTGNARSVDTLVFPAGGFNYCDATFRSLADFEDKAVALITHRATLLRHCASLVP